MEDISIEKAIPFIQISEEGEFDVNVEAMSMLQDIAQSKVSVVIIGGPWRSGKSFLANRLIGQMKGFALGSTIKACTKGIWMWNKPITVPGNPDLACLVLDAEGLNSTERSTDTDHKLFALTLLLSEIFIYNCKGHITESTLEDLSVVINLTKYININKTDSETGLEFNKFFPSMVWVLRDFALQLEKHNSPTDYLEDQLSLKPGDSDEALEKNRIRDTIRSFFTDRECFTLLRPVHKESEIAHIEDLAYSDLRPEFQNEMNLAVKKILYKCKGKKVSGVTLTGQMFLDLSLEYVQAMNDNETPSVLPALTRVLLIQARNITEQLQRCFVDKLAEQVPETQLPLPHTDLLEIVDPNIWASTSELLLTISERLTPDDRVAILHDFTTFMNEEKDNLIKLNIEKSVIRCTALINKTMELIQLPKIQGVEDIKPSLMLDYTNEWNKTFDSYNEFARGPAKYEVLNSFFQDKVFSNFSELMNNTREVYNDNENNLRLKLSELQASEKKWKTICENNEIILAERAKEKEELMGAKNELELRRDQLIREVKKFESEIESNKRLHGIELSNLKQLTETLVKEKNLIIDDIRKKIKGLEGTISELEESTMKLQKENIRIIKDQEFQTKVAEDWKEQQKKPKQALTQQQVAITHLFKTMSSSVEEFKSLISEAQNVQVLKKQIVDLQRELNDKEYHHNKTLLDFKKLHSSELRDERIRHEGDVQQMENESVGFKRTSEIMRDKHDSQQARMDALENRIDLLKKEKMNLEENLNQKESLIEGQKGDLANQKTSFEMISNAKMDLELQLSEIKVAQAIENEDKGNMLILIGELIKKLKGKKSIYKDAIDVLMDEDTKKNLTAVLKPYGL